MAFIFPYFTTTVLGIAAKCPWIPGVFHRDSNPLTRKFFDDSDVILESVSIGGSPLDVINFTATTTKELTFFCESLGICQVKLAAWLTVKLIKLQFLDLLCVTASMFYITYNVGGEIRRVGISPSVLSVLFKSVIASASVSFGVLVQEFKSTVGLNVSLHAIDSNSIATTAQLCVPTEANVVMEVVSTRITNYTPLRQNKKLTGTRVKKPTDVLTFRPVVVFPTYGSYERMDITMFAAHTFARKYLTIDSPQKRISGKSQWTMAAFKAPWSKDSPLHHVPAINGKFIFPWIDYSIEPAEAKDWQIADKILRELDIPKLTAPQNDHDVFLQRLDQASRGLKHEYKDLVPPNRETNPVADSCLFTGLILKHQHKRDGSLMHFLRNH